MTGKTNEELYDILYIHSGDYTADALESAREEFAARKLEADTLSNFGVAADRVRAIEEAHLSWPMRIFAFVFSTAFFGIPVVLAYRHYVEHGAKLKAREFGRWALWGFGFYLLLFVVRMVMSL